LRQLQHSRATCASAPFARASHTCATRTNIGAETWAVGECISPRCAKCNNKMLGFDKPPCRSLCRSKKRRGRRLRFRCRSRPRRCGVWRRGKSPSS
jgi:hypothetical protein